MSSVIKSGRPQLHVISTGFQCSDLSSPAAECAALSLWTDRTGTADVMVLELHGRLAWQPCWTHCFVLLFTAGSFFIHWNCSVMPVVMGMLQRKFRCSLCSTMTTNWTRHTEPVSWLKSCGCIETAFSSAGINFPLSCQKQTTTGRCINS